MSLMTRVLAPITSNRPAQYILERTVKQCLQLMGVGTGTDAWSSGERTMIQRLLSGSTSFTPCFFDVGANKGQFLSLLLSVLGSRAATIHSFEPSAEAFSHLRSVARNDERIRINNTALGNCSGTATLFADQPGSGMGSLTKRSLGYRKLTFDHEESVRITTLDEYCDSHGVAQIDLLKMDVEGHELNVLEGARRMLSQNAIGAIAFEFGGCNIDTRTYFQDFFVYLTNAKMQVYRISPGGYACPVRQYREIYEQFRTTNFLATRAA